MYHSITQGQPKRQLSDDPRHAARLACQEAAYTRKCSDVYDEQGRVLGSATPNGFKPTVYGQSVLNRSK